MSIIIPALNEEKAIGPVVREALEQGVHEVIVVDNGSTDSTAIQAAAAGARVVSQPVRGYGRACHTGAQAAAPSSDVLVFLDGDGSDVLEELDRSAGPALAGEYDFVLGSRLRGRREPGSLLPSQVFAGWLAGVLLSALYGVRYTDMGPFRVISRSAFQQLHMAEMTYGWNLEMQMKAARQKLRVLEVPVTYRNRQGGVSKVAGSLQGSAKAAVRIAEVFLRLARQH